MDLFKEFGVKDHAAAAAQIPVIDFGPVFAGEPGALQRLAPTVGHACENVGFFYAAGHGASMVVRERYRQPISPNRTAFGRARP